MAVEARHLSLFPSQLPAAGIDVLKASGGANLYGNNASAINGFLLAPISGTTTTADTALPVYGAGGSAITDSVAAAKAAAIKSDSGLTHALPAVASGRKRSRDTLNPLLFFLPDQHLFQNARCDSLSFLGEDISLQVQQQQFEIDRFIAQHTEKVRMEMEESRKRFSRRIMAAVEEGVVKKLRSKEEEILKIGKLNWALEERVKSLCIENQIWKDLAQSNEATANALRSNLEQVLAQMTVEQRLRNGRPAEDAATAAALTDDAESCCGSNYGEEEEEERRTIAESRGEERKALVGTDRCNNDDGGAGTINRHGNRNCSGGSKSNRWCRNCGEKEACVLLLPCRHLCLCTVCGSSLHICPVCKSPKNASVHVNLSSS